MANASNFGMGRIQISGVHGIFERSNDSLDLDEYGLWRRVDEQGQLSQTLDIVKEKEIVSANGHPQQLLLNNAIWDFIVTIPAVGFSEYTYVAPTLEDSAILHGLRWSVFMVSAHVSSGEIFFSPPDGGYSVDNLPPLAPTNLSAVQNDEGVVLTWDQLDIPDFDHYAVYRDATPHIKPSSNNRIDISVTNTFVDGVQRAGVYEKDWGKRMASGVYIYAFEAQAVEGSRTQFKKTRKLLLLKESLAISSPSGNTH